MRYNQDYNSLANESSGAGLRYWTGSALANTAHIIRCLRAGLKSTTGWLPLYPCAPLGGASGINPRIMDTLENPLCRGGRFLAPASGKLIGFDFSKAGFTANTSFYFVLASMNCAAELARSEEFSPPSASASYIHRVRFPGVDVVAGTSYDCYVTAGSRAPTTGGVSLTALDTSEDSGAVIESYGVPTGALMGLSVHEPPTEGGTDVPTVTLDHIIPIAPVYSEITTSGGGGSGRARARSF